MSECTCNLFTMTRTHAKLCFSEAKSSKYKNKDIRYTYNLSSTTRTHQIYLKKESAYLTIICETAVFCALVCRGIQSLSNSHANVNSIHYQRSILIFSKGNIENPLRFSQSQIGDTANARYLASYNRRCISRETLKTVAVSFYQ